MYGQLDQAIGVASRYDFVRSSKQVSFESCFPAFAAERWRPLVRCWFTAAVLTYPLLALDAEILGFVQQSMHAEHCTLLLLLVTLSQNGTRTGFVPEPSQIKHRILS